MVKGRRLLGSVGRRPFALNDRPRVLGAPGAFFTPPSHRPHRRRGGGSLPAAGRRSRMGGGRRPRGTGAARLISRAPRGRAGFIGWVRLVPVPERLGGARLGGRAPPVFR